MVEEWIEAEIEIGKVAQLLLDYDVEVTSPDGWVHVVDFVDKGEWDEYVLDLRDGRSIRCNENHLFETVGSGWKSASDIEKEGLTSYFVDENHVFDIGTVRKTGARIPIVDIQVASENHRYFTNGISSHNTGVGKSLAMCHFASANLVAGKNVLYITMEMAEEKISERIDVNLMNVTSDELALMSKANFKKKVDEIRSRTVGKLVVKEYPTASAGSATFRALLGELKTKKNFVPDIIYIDYLNICMSSRIKMGSAVNSYTYIKTIAEELRGLAVEFNVPIVSATQTTRSGYCIDPKTVVETTDGITTLDALKIGDSIVTENGYNVVQTIFPSVKKKAYCITTADGKSIICSADHKFPTDDGEKSIASGLSEKMYLKVKCP